MGEGESWAAICAARTGNEAARAKGIDQEEGIFSRL